MVGQHANFRQLARLEQVPDETMKSSSLTTEKGEANITAHQEKTITNWARTYVPPVRRLVEQVRREFLRSHWDVLAAADFFTVEVWSVVGLRRYHVLFVMELATRRVEIAGISDHPNSTWMEQLARNLTDAFEGFLVGKRHLDQEPRSFTPRRRLAQLLLDPRQRRRVRHATVHYSAGLDLHDDEDVCNGEQCRVLGEEIA